MNVLVNGDEVELDDRASVVDAVKAVRSDGRTRGVAVAVNGTVVPRSAWETPLEESDRVEILTAVAGG